MYLSQINIYPLKSARGLSLQTASLSPFGLENDRRWMVVDEKGRFLTQRRFPQMALIEATPHADGIELRLPDSETQFFPNQFSNLRPIRIWGHDDFGADLGDRAAEVLSQFLGIPCRLVTTSPQFHRPIDANYAPQGGQVQFSDGFPLLLISEGSLELLNQKLQAVSHPPLPMDRFRPNLVVKGCEPHAEDSWKTIDINGLQFNVVKPCSRCTVPTVDQQTGKRGSEPTNTLATYRQAVDGEIYFGQNLIARQSVGTVQIGDVIRILD